MSKKLNLSKNTKAIIALVLVAIMSIGLSFVMSKPEMYKPVYEVLDEKRADALALSGAALGLSTTVSLVFENRAKSITDMLSDVTSYTMIIVCVIFLEKLLLTSFGFLTFAVIIPLSCLIGILFIWLKKDLLKALAIKLTAFGLVLFMVVPSSVLLTNLIERTNFYSDANINIDEALGNEEDLSLVEKLKDKSTDLITKAKAKINEFIDAIAVMLITTCAIPLGTLALLLWIVKMLFGINIKVPKPPRVNLVSKKTDKDDIANQLPPANE